MPFPTLTNNVKPDSSQFSEELEDVSMRTELEGGYVATRAKHTRAPRKTWNVTYRMLLDEDKLILKNFWDSVRGGSVIFDWTNPADSVTYSVRFKESMKFRYVGVGNSHRWDCSFTLEQA